MEPCVSCIFTVSHLLYGLCVKIFIMNRYISKSYTTSKNTIDRQYTKRGQLLVSTITSHYFIQCYMYLRLTIFRCTFCGNFWKTGKNIPVLEIGYSRSYFHLFLIYAVACDTHKYKPSQIYKQFEVDSSKDRLDTKILT